MSATRRPDTNWQLSMKRLRPKLKTSTCHSLVGRLRINGGSNPIGRKATTLPTKLMMNGHPPELQSLIIERNGTKLVGAFVAWNCTNARFRIKAT